MRNVHDFDFDYCAYGAAWRKRTKLMYVHVDMSPCALRCTGKGKCSFTHRPHVRLEGQQMASS
eukprot:11411369-Heterocapsa_arctica.AAC.1